MKLYIGKEQRGRRFDSLRSEKAATDIRKAGIPGKKVIAAILTSIVISGAFFIFADNHHIPVPFDPDHMSVELYKAAVITDEKGITSWMDVDIFKDIIPKDCDKVMDVAELTYQGIYNLNGNAAGKSISRNNEKVRVVYYCYTKTLWDSLWFVDSYLEHIGYTEKGGGYERQIYGNDYESAEYEPQTTEIYYLPIKDFDAVLDNLSDEEYYKLKEKGELVWSGII